MIRASSQACPFSSWTQARSVALLQKRKPSRMELSHRVAQSTPKQTSSGKPVKRKTNGPFGALNQTSANIRPNQEPYNKRSQPEVKRSTRGRESAPKKQRDGYHALKMQRALGSVSYGHRTAIKRTLAGIDSFGLLGLSKSVQDSITSQALPGLKEITPTAVQRLAIPAILGTYGRPRQKSGQMEQFLLAAETGSGKTMAYLLPVIDAIKRAEAVEAEEEAQEKGREQAEREKNAPANMYELPSPPVDAPHPSTGRPRAVILVPTAELVAQVGSLAKAFSHTVKFKASPISAAYSPTVIRNRLFSPSGIDIVISTPHLLASIAESDPNVLSRVSHLVVDEADSLLDRSFSPLTSEILDKATPSLKQLILCSATIPKSLDSFLRNRFPDLRRLVTPNLHAIPRRVQLGVVDADKEPYRGNKNLACAETIWNISKLPDEYENFEAEHASMKRVIVFVNEREKTVEVADYLVTKGIDAVALNRDAEKERHTKLLAEFKGAQPNISPYNEPPAPGTATFTPGVMGKRRLANVKVLVMTDLGSRGIDTTAVKHVILYDVPHTTIDFIHRLGRTGRMGRRGRGVVLVGKGDRRDVVKEVREGMFKGQALI
ncbi:ATP-dependent RNA helicase mrh4, mitochondrial [Patellaria atrata CBS 101060]|uniref:RNA helicase n=1 Tax=Patellaria atrata CBS 101060 TaxID=1346257 RepID=A0A9P4S893_9PEZI|nr:ATP-dependent RNA helicase mrh4, mitochondrial [Patellaria atrata CBS 101060]